MIRGLLGAILGLAVAFILEVIGINIYVIDFLQSYLGFEVDTYAFYKLFVLVGALLGFLRR